MFANTIPICDLCYANILAGAAFFECSHSVLCQVCAQANTLEVNRVMVDHTTRPFTAKKYTGGAQ